MSLRDRLLAAVVAVLWGANFTAIHASLEHFPPFFLAALRFALIAVPTVLLVPRPRVRLRWLVGYGVGFGVLQFAFLYLAMTTGMPAGLSSLVLQSSAPFTVVLAAWLLRERLTGRQVLGVLLAVAGLAGIAAHRGLVGGSAALLPVLLTVAGGLGWALGNLASRQARPDSPMRLMAWMSVVPVLPLLALSLVLEGPTAITQSLTTLDAPTAGPALLGLAYTVLVATVVGTGLWTTLLARNPSSSVAPFSMLVPVVGIAVAGLVLRERTEPLELALGALVVGGVLVGSVRRRPQAEVPGLGTTSAVASAATPSPRPVRPSPSVVVAETCTEAPTAADSAASASARRGPSRGRLPMTWTATLPISKPATRTRRAASPRSAAPGAPAQRGSLVPKVDPRSPSPAAASSASAAACAATSASE